MYKINIEKCISGHGNKFELILKASNLARKMITEENLTLADKKKPVMRALKEIEEDQKNQKENQDEINNLKLKT